ncbi:Betaine aldehyde dehydrogenase [Candidatus Methanoperedenaceae archaeon GB37]|nr:Betaine aldehyde dehydrogenase [Candidatus Methanoperedenaceae archaeon GB37]
MATSDIDMISFTGASETFKKIFESIKRPKKAICELSGINLAIVFSDADLEEAAENIMASAFMKQGQMCINTSVCLIEEGIYKQFLELLSKKMEKIKVGDPSSALTGMGPLRSKKHLEEVVNKVEEFKKKGQKSLKAERH